jgi:hypothetical protein
VGGPSFPNSTSLRQTWNWNCFFSNVYLLMTHYLFWLSIFFWVILVGRFLFVTCENLDIIHLMLHVAFHFYTLHFICTFAHLHFVFFQHIATFFYFSFNYL